jgi:hypothetical protein
MVASSPTNLVANVNDSPVGSVLILGSARQGQTLTATNNISDADNGLGTITYSWYASGSNAALGTGASYTLSRAEVGKTITVRASYTDGFGTAEEVASDATIAVSGNNAPTGLVSIKGKATQNQKLTASHTLKDADGMGAVTYQWSADGSAIGGATSSTTASNGSNSVLSTNPLPIFVCLLRNTCIKFFNISLILMRRCNNTKFHFQSKKNR